MLSKEELNELPETMKYGILVNKRDFEKEKVDILLEKLYSQNTNIALLRSLLGSDEQLLRFLDIMAGINLKFPTHTTLLKVINEIDIWTTLKRQGFSDCSVKHVSNNYKIPSAKIRAIYEDYESKFGDGNSEGTE